MSLKYLNEVRTLDVESLLDFLNENGYGEFRQILRVKGIDGDKFLNLTEFDVMRWKPLGINTKKMWSCIVQLKQNSQSLMGEQIMQDQMESSRTYDNVPKPTNPLPPQKIPLPDKPKIPPLPKLLLPPSKPLALPLSAKFQTLSSPPPPPPMSSPSPPSRSPQTLPTPPKVQVLPSPPRLQILPTPPRLQKVSSPSPPPIAAKKANMMSSLKPHNDEVNTYLQMENLKGNRFEKKENHYLIPINNAMTDNHQDDSYEPMDETSKNFPTSTPHFTNIRPKMKMKPAITPMKVIPISLRPPQTLPRGSDASYIAPDGMDDEDEDFAPPSDEVYEPSPEVPPESVVPQKTTYSRKALPELPTEDEDTYEPTPGSAPLVLGKQQEKPPLPKRNFQMTQNNAVKRKMSPRIYENTEVEMEQMLLDNKDDSFSKRILNFFKSPISKRYRDETKQGTSEFYKADSPDPDLEEYENITMPVSNNESIFKRPLPGLPVEKLEVGMEKMSRPNASMERMMEPNAGMKQRMKSYDGTEPMMELNATMEQMMKTNSEMDQEMKPTVGMEQIMKPKAAMEKMMKPKAGMEKMMKSDVGMERMMKPKAAMENLMKPNVGMEQMMAPADGRMKQMMTTNDGMEHMMKSEDEMKKNTKLNELQGGIKSEMIHTPTSLSSPVYGNHEIFQVPDALDDTDEEFNSRCESPSIYENKETFTSQDTKTDRGELIKKLSMALNLRNRRTSQDLEKNEGAKMLNLPSVNVQNMSENTTPETEKPEAMTKSMPELDRTGKLNAPGKDELIRKLSLALNLDKKRMSKDFEETGQMNVSRVDSPDDDDPIYGNDPENASSATPEKGGQMLNMPNFPSNYDHHFIDSKMNESHKMLPAPPADLTPEFSDDELEEYDTIVYNLNSEPFFRNTDRKGAKLYLEGQSDGVYLIRPSRNNKEFDLTLNIKYQTKIFNMGIYKSKNKYHYQCDIGMSKEQFSTLHDLIQHFKTHPLHFNYKNRVTDIFLTHTLPSDLV